jgi:ATP-dependent DNA helicase RecG
MNAEEILSKLNQLDECSTIEAKKGSAIDTSILQTICAFANGPNLGGGNILLAVRRDESSFLPRYEVCGIKDPDKLQLDLSTQCAHIFNIPIRPQIYVERLSDKAVINVFVPELPEQQKPLYFKKDGLPKGAFRRIGSSDQRCNDEDLYVFYNSEDSFDNSFIQESNCSLKMLTY